MGISITVGISAGTDISEASADAIALAERMGVVVNFKFNGVSCIAIPGANPDVLAALYHDELISDSPCKIVCAHP